MVEIWSPIQHLTYLIHFNVLKGVTVVTIVTQCAGIHISSSITFSHLDWEYEDENTDSLCPCIVHVFFFCSLQTTWPNGIDVIHGPE